MSDLPLVVCAKQTTRQSKMGLNAPRARRQRPDACSRSTEKQRRAFPRPARRNVRFGPSAAALAFRLLPSLHPPSGSELSPLVMLHVAARVDKCRCTVLRGD